MAEFRLSEVKQKLESYKSELIISISITIPIFLFILFALLESDFTVLDHSYWVSVVAYNIVIVVGVWFVHSNRTLHLSPGVLIYGIGLFILIQIVFLIPFFTGDITQGVITGSKVLWEGENPYVVEKVPHAQPDSPDFRWTTYAYLPVDLLTYTILLGLMSIISLILDKLIIPANLTSYLPGFNLAGFLIINICLMVISILLIWKILEVKLKNAFLLGLTFFIILLWNNVCLAQTLFFTGWYFHKRNQPNLTIFFWTLSMLSKYFAGIFIVAYIVHYLRKKEYRLSLPKIVLPIIVTLIFLIPFGIMNVLKSTVFFYNSEERTLDGSMGGSLVSELVLWLNLEDMVWLFTLIGFICILVIAFLISSLYQRLITTSLLALLFISGFSAQFFPMILFIFILIKKIVFFPIAPQILNSDPEFTI